MQLFLLAVFETSLDTNGSQLLLVMLGKAGVCSSFHHFVTWPECLLALGCSNSDSEMRVPQPCAVLQDVSWGFDLGKWRLSKHTACTHLEGQLFSFSVKTDGSFVHREPFGMPNPAVLPPTWFQNHCRSLTPSPLPILIRSSQRDEMVNLTPSSY